MPDPALEAHSVGMVFNAGTAKAVPAFEDISFTLAPGETLAIVGPSGCGKTTLFNVIAGLLRPRTGSVSVAGPPLMMVAGLGGVANWWTETLPAFTPHFRVILHDQRGTGRSSRVAVRSVGQMAADALALIDHLGLAQTAWLGHSTGGAIGVDLALDHPGRIGRLVVNSSTTRGDDYRRRVFAIRRLLHVAAGSAAYAQFTTLLLYPPWFINAHSDRLAAEETRAAAGLGDPAIQGSRLDAILAWDRSADFRSLRAHTLVICAEDDILTPMPFSEEFAASIPGARLIRAPTGGHALSRTRPDLFEPPVLRFLRELQE